MEFIEIGKSDGQLVIFFHVVPGATQECKKFEADADDNELRILCFDRFSL